MRQSVRLALPAVLGSIVMALTVLAPDCSMAAADPNEAMVGNPPEEVRANGEPAPVSNEEIEQLLKRYRDMAPKAAPPSGPVVRDMTEPLIQVGPLGVRAMPGSDFGQEPGITRRFTWVGRNLILWGRISGGSGSYSATWDPGDGSGPQPANVSNPNYVYLLHGYASFGPKTAVLQVTDLNTLEVASANVLLEVDVAPPAQQTRVNAAIEDGLRYLYLQQQPDGLWWGYGYPGTDTGLAVAAFELAKHAPMNPPELDVYADRVRVGLEAMIGQLQYYPISPQPAGNPDLASPFGLGVAHVFGSGAYSQGIMMLALARSDDPNAVATTGPLAGDTYRTILANMVDQLAFSQTDGGPERGGWRYDIYSASYGSDNSAVQWASIGLEAAVRYPWEIQAAPFVKPELEAWLNTSQCPTGCFGYTSQFWCNAAKTGSGIFSHLYIGTPKTDPRVQNGLGCLDANWCAGVDDSSTPEMLNGNYYAMYAVKKALYDYEIVNVGAHAWYSDFQKQLVKGLSSPCGNDSWHQVTDNDAPLSDGWWPGGYWIYDPVTSTSFALLILIPDVVCPRPEAVAQAIPAQACPGTEICFDGSTSSAPPGREIQQWLWDYHNNGTIDATGPYVCAAPGTFPLPDSLTMIQYPVLLTVIDNYADSTCTAGQNLIWVTIGTENHPPIPVTGGPYTACVCDTIRLDGCLSFDPDAECIGDSICEYLWDLNADGIPDYTTTDCVPDTFLVFCQETEQEIQLRVRDCQGMLSDSQLGRVRVWSSIRELSVATTDIQLTPPTGCDSVLVTATIHAATQIAGAVIPPADLEIYIDDPTCSSPANRLCARLSPALMDGESFAFSCMWARPDTLPHTVSVCIDRNQLIKECIETDNVATVTATCVTNGAPDCSAAAPSIAEIWPANHKMVPISILGVTDADGDSVTITVTGITQDEPLDELGDGSTEPDGEGIGTSTARLRAERSGTPKTPGNGRVYVIAFTASDGHGGECTGTVSVCVPHDQRPGHECIDDGQSYDSTGQAFADRRTRAGRASFGSTPFPNPFNPTTTIQYTLPEASHVRIVVYDAQGRRVRTLVDATQAAGTYDLQWDGRDQEGMRLASGVYMYRIEAGARSETKRLLLIK